MASSNTSSRQWRSVAGYVSSRAARVSKRRFDRPEDHSLTLVARCELLAPRCICAFAGLAIGAAKSDGNLKGPAGIYPGLSPLDKPGQSVLLFANGFG